MRQAIHIFKKDVRHLWYQIALTLLVVAAFMFVGVRQALSSTEPSGDSGMVDLFLVLSWWTLIARVIHAEALAGDRQFWCTRPYVWRGLLGAKALFILAFINLPIVIADAVILKAYGFSLIAELPGLLWNQVILTVALILPMAALAAVTTGLTQFLSATSIIGLAFFGLSIGSFGMAVSGQGGALDWIRSSCALVMTTTAAALVILWQYKRRKTMDSRVLIAATCAIAGLFYLFIPWTAAFGIQSRLSKVDVDPASVQIAFDAGRKWLARSLAVRDDRVQIEIPLQITGVPDGMDVRANGLSVGIETPDGTVWRSNDKPWMQVNSEARITSLQTTIDDQFYKKIRNEPVRLRGSLYLTLGGHSHEVNIPFRRRSTPSAEAGVCSATREESGITQSSYRGPGVASPNSNSTLKRYMLLCHYAFRSPSDFLSVYFEHSSVDVFREPVSYSPFPAQLTFSPVTQYFASSISSGEASGITVVAVQPIAFLQRDFDFGNIRLSDFEGLQSTLH